MEKFSPPHQGTINIWWCLMDRSVPPQYFSYNCLHRWYSHLLQLIARTCKSCLTDLTRTLDQTELSWPKPWTIKELVAATLDLLLKRKPNTVNWTDVAIQSFQNLKNQFTSAFILHHPDPSVPFMVAREHLWNAILAILSQRHGNPFKVHPCSQFYRCSARDL